MWLQDATKLSSYVLHVGHSTLVGQRPMKSLSSVCPSVTKFSQDWIIRGKNHAKKIGCPNLGQTGQN